MNTQEKPDFLFETSWEVCNKVGGINTVIATKALKICEHLGNAYFMIGPDIHKEPLPADVFAEDTKLYPHWVAQARLDGFRFRIGRWNVAGNPIAILIDFTGLFAKKDVLFIDLWEKFKLDSLYGGWDYVEPALFGYEAARLIEHFYQFNLTADDRLTAHFHEWMTGAGILYLKDKVPQAGCVFTTHATVLGRSVAGMNMPLYGKMEQYNPDSIARELNVLSKFSLEKLSAEHADVFTTVSEITGRECSHFLSKKPDIITPNGFEDSFVPSADNFADRRAASRDLLKRLLKAVSGKEADDSTLFVINSGRYEYRNKGIDVFIEALANLRNLNTDGRDVVAIIAVPANNAGVRHEVRQCMLSGDAAATPGHVTHYLFNEENDPIVKAVEQFQLQNSADSKVSIIFIPSYLDGNDGLLNLHYYDLLIGCDLSVFPSYYEPWGYTPLESVAFHIPTITTTLAGFGLWMKDSGKSNGGVKVIDRDDFNASDVATKITEILQQWLQYSDEEISIHRESAFKASREALWQNLSQYYFDAYRIAVTQTQKRYELFSNKTTPQAHPAEKMLTSSPSWRKVFVRPSYPERLNKLIALTKNLWWTWNFPAQKMFSQINPQLWEKSGFNPLTMMELLSFNEITALAENNDFLQTLDAVSADFETYMSKERDQERPSVAYFCMEYGFHSSLKLYSGGLGVLAGDYLKQASDSCVRMTAIGLLFRHGYFTQSLSSFGDQIANYQPQKFSNLPMIPVRKEDGEWLKITLGFPGRRITAKVWEVNVGRVKLFLLDTDIDENNQADRQITHQLYGGDWENRLKQELLLGFGGVKVLNELNLKHDVYHCNEGHAAFSILERLKDLIQDEVMSMSQALEIVRAATLFTTHTPVPAGHDSFSEDMMRMYLAHYPERLNISWKEFMSLGKMNPDNESEKFSMSILAMSGSQNVNGVSRIHGRVTRDMFTSLYKGYFSDELYIDYVTNGVHLPTWSCVYWQDLMKKNGLDPLESDQAEADNWRFFETLKDEEIWTIRKTLKKRMVDFLNNKLARDLTKRQEAPRHIISVLENLDEKALYIGFARRFATYKRAHLLFKNIEKLKELVNNKQRPVRFVFSGKAHPADKAGQDYIKHIVEISRMPELAGKIIFLENYDMEVAKILVSGVDVWLNTPTRPLEASGTSGIKACLNGALNLSVLDGWWAEGFIPKGGWALKEARTYDDQTLQDELDAETLYNLLEDDVLPLYYKRASNDIPCEWISYIRKNFTAIAPHFTMKRMLDEYYSKFYIPQSNRSKVMNADNFEVARVLASWKRK
ncbi:MAG: alpha-glucan family phosphorylase, partial [Bacteroidetes bacterium HGW-Bacteroidetes-6]